MSKNKKLFSLIALLIVALLSFFVLSKIAVSPQFHASTIETLDSKKLDVTTLTTASAAASVAISMIPGDATTPIANQIASLSSYLLLVLCAIFFEKCILTISGYITFYFLIPLSCLLLMIHLYKNKPLLKTLALKFTAFGLSIFLLVPISAHLMNIIDSTFEFSKSLEATTSFAEELKKEIDAIPEEPKENSNQDIGFFPKMQNAITSGAAKIKATIAAAVNSVKAKSKDVLNHFIDTIAALIITSCVIPVTVMFCLLWIIKLIFGIDVKLPKKNPMHSRKTEKNENPLNV